MQVIVLGEESILLHLRHQSVEILVDGRHQLCHELRILEGTDLILHFVEDEFSRFLRLFLAVVFQADAVDPFHPLFEETLDGHPRFAGRFEGFGFGGRVRDVGLLPALLLHAKLLPELEDVIQIRADKHILLTKPLANYHTEEQQEQHRHDEHNLVATRSLAHEAIVVVQLLLHIVLLDGGYRSRVDDTDDGILQVGLLQQRLISLPIIAPAMQQVRPCGKREDPLRR